MVNYFNFISDSFTQSKPSLVHLKQIPQSLRSFGMTAFGGGLQSVPYNKNPLVYKMRLKTASPSLARI